jgi:prophage tail gpP-like protein
LKITLGNRELEIISGSIIRSMDTAASEWSCVIPEVDQDIDQELYDLIKPRSFAVATASIDGIKLSTGNKYITSATVTNSGSGVMLQGFSKTFRLSISNPRQQQEFLRSSLEDISLAFSRPFGLVVKYGDEVSVEMKEKFADEKIGALEIVYAFLQNLARQRGILMSDDVFGNIKYLKANAKQKTVGSIIEGKDGLVPMAQDFKATFDDTQIKQNYYSINNSSLAFLISNAVGVSKNTSIKIPSFKAIQLDSLVEGAGQKAVDFARNYDLATSMQMPFEVEEHYAPNGELWKENTFVSVVSPSLFVPEGFTFLIRQVEYKEDSDGGKRTILSLIPPLLYAGGNIEEPW